MNLRDAKPGQKVCLWHYGSGVRPGYHGAKKMLGTIQKVTKHRLRILCDDGQSRVAEPENVDLILEGTASPLTR